MYYGKPIGNKSLALQKKLSQDSSQSNRDDSFIKIYMNEAWSKDGNKLGNGVIARDQHGILLVSLSLKSSSSRVEIVEAKADPEGLLLAEARG